MTENQPSLQSIRRVKRQVELDLVDLANVHAVDIGEKITDGTPTGELSIIVYVDKKRKQIAAKDRVPEEISGIRTDVQESEPDVLHPLAVRIADDEVLVDKTRYATLEGGMSIGPCRAIYLEPPDVDEAGWYIFVGTLGAIVKDKDSGDPLILTNFHVAMVDDTWSVGDDMAQPSRLDGGVCPGDRVGALLRGSLSHHVDGALISIEDRPHVCEILDIGGVKGTKTAADGISVRKRGRTTELTHGTVISTNYTTTINYGDGLGSVTLIDQLRIQVSDPPSSMFGTNGDSGSVVVDDDEYIVGLYFAGTPSGDYGVANPIADVLGELNIEVCTKPIIKLKKENWKEFWKEHPKEFIKEWKEWAFEKEYIETYERPPWLERPPRWRPPEVQPPRVTTPPVGVRGAAEGVRPMAGTGWIEDMGVHAPGSAPNPVGLEHLSATVVQWDGTLAPVAGFVDWGAGGGLNVNYYTTLVLCGECYRLRVTLTHYSSPATVYALDRVGNVVDSKTMTVAGTPETLLLASAGPTGILYIVVEAPQNETILHKVECTGRQRFKHPREAKWSQFEHPPWLESPGVVEPRNPAAPPPRPFVGHDLRPDMRRGALRGESDFRASE